MAVNVVAKSTPESMATIYLYELKDRINAENEGFIERK